MTSKPNMEILGTFSQPSYTTVNDAYTKPNKRDPKVKGKPQMMSHTSKSKSATADGYFTKTFSRAFEKEPTHDAVTARRKRDLAARKKMIGPDYKPASPVKKMASSGHYQGTFAELKKSSEIGHFVPELKRTGKKPKEARNFLTNPGKKGTGGHHFGGNTVGITIGKSPGYKGSPFNAEELQKRSERKAHAKAVKGAPFKAPCGPDGGNTFDKNPFRQPKTMPKPKKAAAEKKVTVPFRPNGTAPPMYSGGNSKDGFSKFTYTGEKASTTVRKPKASGPVFKPISNPKSMPQSSVVAINVYRSVNPNNASRVAVL